MVFPVGVLEVLDNIGGGEGLLAAIGGADDDPWPTPTASGMLESLGREDS